MYKKKHIYVTALKIHRADLTQAELTQGRVDSGDDLTSGRVDPLPGTAPCPYSLVPCPFTQRHAPFLKLPKMPYILVKKNHENLTKTKELSYSFFSLKP